MEQWMMDATETDVCFVPSQGCVAPPRGNSPDSTPVTVLFARRFEASCSEPERIDVDFSPPADLMSQHLTVESRLPDTRTDDSAENDNDVIGPLWPVIFLMGLDEPRSHSQMFESRPIST